VDLSSSCRTTGIKGGDLKSTSPGFMASVATIILCDSAIFPGFRRGTLMTFTLRFSCSSGRFSRIYFSSGATLRSVGAVADTWASAEDGPSIAQSGRRRNGKNNRKT